MSLSTPIVLVVRPEQRSESEMVALTVNGFNISSAEDGLIRLKYSVPGLPKSTFIMVCRDVSIFEENGESIEKNS